MARGFATGVRRHRLGPWRMLEIPCPQVLAEAGLLP